MSGAAEICDKLRPDAEREGSPALLRWLPYLQLMEVEGDGALVEERDDIRRRLALTENGCEWIDWQLMIETVSIMSGLALAASGRRDLVEKDAAGLYEASKALVYCTKLIKELWEIRTAYKKEIKADERFANVLRDIAREAENVQVGRCLVVPCGFCDNQNRGVLMLLVATRNEIDSFDFVLINRGREIDGSRYHAAKIDVDQIKRQRVIILASIPRHKVIHAATWYILWRSLILPRSPSQAPSSTIRIDLSQDFYETALPFFSKVIRTPPDDEHDDADTDETDDSTEIYDSLLYDEATETLTTSATARCVLEALKYAAPGKNCLCATLICGLEIACAQSDHVSARGSLQQDDAYRLELASQFLSRKLRNKRNNDSLLIAGQRVAKKAEALVRTEKLQRLQSNQLRLNDFIKLGQAPTSLHFTALPTFLQESTPVELTGPEEYETPPLPIRLAELFSGNTEPNKKNYIVPDHISAALAMRRADRACVILENQRHLVPNAPARRFALVSHIFIRVLPAPAPLNTKRKCFWRSQSMRRESQRDLLSLLRRLAAHLAAAAWNLEATRELDGERAIVLAACAAIADAIVRCHAIDDISPLSKFYSPSSENKNQRENDGILLHPRAQPFGFDVRYFAADTSRFLLCEPALVNCRSQVLEYFRSIREHVPSSNEIFKWETHSGLKPTVHIRLSLGDARLLDRLCASLGFPRSSGGHGSELAAYLSGELPGLIDHLPELADFRDLVVLLKAATAPKALSHAKTHYFLANEARPIWRLAEKEAGDERQRRAGRHAKFPPRIADAVDARLSVSAFGQDLDLSVGSEDQLQALDDDLLFTANETTSSAESTPNTASVFSTFLTRLRAALEPGVAPRAPPSGGDPSHLAGELISTEDDVLHLKTLPSDLGVTSIDHHQPMAPRDVERLLCYLTAPYLRLPLVLKYFAAADKASYLRDSRLRAVIESVLFEPGPWLPPGIDPIPTEVPAINRKHLRTNYGALINELALSPAPTLDAILTLLHLALDTLEASRGAKSFSLDVGANQVALFCIRLASRVYTFAQAVANCDKAETLNSLEAPSLSQDLCQNQCVILKKLLIRRVVPGLRRWLPALYAKLRLDTNSKASSDVEAACALHAHIGYIYAKCFPFDTFQEETDAVKALLSAQCFLAAYGNRSPHQKDNFFNAATTANAESAQADAKGSTRTSLQQRTALREVGITDTELAGLWQSQRYWLLQWLIENLDGPGADCLEAAVAAVAAVNPRSSQQNSVIKNRKWYQLVEFPGRFAPEVVESENNDAHNESDDDYQTWLTHELDAASLRTEVIDVQLGEFTLRRKRIDALPEKVRDHPDLIAALRGHHLSSKEGEDRAAELSKCLYKRHWKIVSKRVDVIAWLPPPPLQLGKAPPLYALSAPFDLTRQRPLEKINKSTEMWIKNAVAFATRQVPANTSKQRFFIPKEDCSSRRLLHIQGFAIIENDDAPRWREIRIRRDAFIGLFLVELYDVVEHARNWRRVLRYTSDVSKSLGTPVQTHDLEMTDLSNRVPLERGHTAAAERPAPSVAVSRIATRCSSLKVTQQSFIPRRFLSGALPDALLDKFSFWYNHDDRSFIGYGIADDAMTIVIVAPISNKRGSGTVTRYRLRHKEKIDMDNEQVLTGPSTPGSFTHKVGTADKTPEKRSTRFSVVSSLFSRSRAKVNDNPSTLTDSALQTKINQSTADIPLPIDLNGFEVDPTICGASLVCLQDARHAQLADKLSRLDSLGHVLLWVSNENDASAINSTALVSRLELPRLGLHFVRDILRNDQQPRLVLRSLEYVGLHLAEANRMGNDDDMDVEDDAADLITALPAALVLADETNPDILKVLIGAGSKPFRAEKRKPLFSLFTLPKPKKENSNKDHLEVSALPCSTLLDHDDVDWRQAHRSLSHLSFDVDRVAASLVPNSVEAAAALLLIYTCTRHYIEAARLAPLCISDQLPRPRSIENVAIALGSQSLGEDMQPDAIACRLALSLVCLDTGCEGGLTTSLLPWRLSESLSMYVAQRSRVTPRLRLCRIDERRAFEQLRASNFIANLSTNLDDIKAPLRRAIHNRALAIQKETNPQMMVTPPTFDLYRGLVDRATGLPSAKGVSINHAKEWLVLTADESTVDKTRPFPTASLYERPIGFEPIVQSGDNTLPASTERHSLRLFGAQAISWLRKAYGYENLQQPLVRQWPAVYELLTGSLPMRVGERDGAFGWGCALLYLATSSLEISKSKYDVGMLASTLNILSRRGQLTMRLTQSGDLPKYRPPEKAKSVMESLTTVSSEHKQLNALWLRCARALRAAKVRGEVSIGETATAPTGASTLMKDTISRRGSRILMPADEQGLVLMVARDLDAASGSKLDSKERIASSTITDWHFAPREAGAALGLILTQTAQQTQLHGHRGRIDCGAMELNEKGAQARSRLEDTALVELPLNGIASEYAPRVAKSIEKISSSYITIPLEAVRGEPTSDAHARHLDKAAQEDTAQERTATIPNLRGFSDALLDSSEATTALKALRKALAVLDHADASAAKTARLALSRLANGDGGSHVTSLRRWCAINGGLVRRIGFGDLLKRMTTDSIITDQEDRLVYALTCGVALLEGRAAHARRCDLLAKRLASRVDQYALLEKSGQSDAIHRASAELILEGEALAESLWEKREHFVSTANPGSYTYDARLLLAEQAFGIQLRASQVSGARLLAEEAKQGISSVRQMIMGSGKTTILTPSLIAMLADGSRLVSVVVPSALLVFTRTALRGRLGTAALGYRPVRTLHFGRRTLMAKEVLQRLELCARQGGVVIADPTSVKALFLKSIETLHRLDEAMRHERDLAAETRFNLEKKRNTKTSFASVLFGPSKKKLERERRAAAALGVAADTDSLSTSAGNSFRVSEDAAGAALATQAQAASAAEESSLRDQTDVAAKVLQLLRQGVALLDEVDLVLHPLKSELNWPLGAREPLDFTTQTTPIGLRWRVPHLLVDAILCAADKALASSSTMNNHRNPVKYQSSLQEEDQEVALGMPRALEESDDEADDFAEDDDDQADENEAAAARTATAPRRAADDEGIATRLALRAAHGRIDEIVAAGLADGCLQSRPHVTLVSEKWYHTILRPALTKWIVLMLRSPSQSAASLAGAGVAGDLGGVDDTTLAKYLLGELDTRDAAASSFVELRCSDDQTKLLNLYHSWLNHMLPFALSRVNRVNYGLLSRSDLQRAVQRFRDDQLRLTGSSATSMRRIAAVPKARRLLAVPFVGKDRPSEASEFSHPDVLIGLTTLAYCHEGLRDSDIKKLVRNLQMSIETDENDGSAYEKRPSARRFAKYVRDGGFEIRAVSSGGTNRLSKTKTTTENSNNGSIEEEVWPLQLVDLVDPEQFRIVSTALRRSRLACRDYLWRTVFPETLALRPAKLAASGQELGGNAIFGARVGFSGTPNDLVPADVGACRYEAATDGRVARVLSDADVVAAEAVESGWTPHSILERVASREGMYQALIDAGALITGLTNRQVAEFLLLRLSADHVDGVLFLDEDDKPLVALRSSKNHEDTQQKLDESVCDIVAESECGVPFERRFTFYDHAHCTGLDIKQRVDATAAVTLSKDTTFRDMAQAAFRLRGLGRGQRIVIFLIPELAGCVAEAVRRDKNTIAMDFKRASIDNAMNEDDTMLQHNDDDVRWLQNVLSWLVVNAIRKERVNFFLLAEQNVLNVVRKVAHRELIERRGSVGSALATGDRGAQWLRGCLDVFRTRVDFTVENAVPTPVPFSQRVASAIEDHAELMSDATDFSTAQRMLQIVTAAEDSAQRAKADQRAEAESRARFAASCNGDQSLIATMTTTPRVEARAAASFEGLQEQEEEEEEEQEQEQQQEVEHKAIEVAIVDEEERRFDEAEKLRYSRDDEMAMPWKLEILKSAPAAASALDVFYASMSASGTTAEQHPFYALADFALYKQSYLSGRSKPPRVEFPGELRVSPNYFRSKWRTAAARRLKNISIVLEYDPESGDTQVDDDVADANFQSQLKASASVAELKLQAESHRRAGERLKRGYAFLSKATAGYDESQRRQTNALRHAPGQLSSVSKHSENNLLMDDSTASQETQKDLISVLNALRGSVSLLAASIRGTKGTETDVLPANAAYNEEAFASTFIRRALRPRHRSTTYVILSLAEAEHIRGVFHAHIRAAEKKRRNQATADTSTHFFPKSAALRVVGAWNGTCHEIASGVGAVLDATPDRIQPPLEHDTKIMACLQFFDVADELSPRHAALLLRALQRTPVPDRLRFRDDIRACRRRPRVATFSATGWLSDVVAGLVGTSKSTNRESAVATSKDSIIHIDTSDDMDYGELGDDDVTASSEIPRETSDVALRAINRRRAKEAGALIARKPSMRFGHAALVLEDEAAVIEFRLAFVAVRRALRRRGAPLSALLRRAVRASVGAAVRLQQEKGIAQWTTPEALFPIGAVAAALRWLGVDDFDATAARLPDFYLNLAKALDLNRDGWIAIDELRVGVLDAAVFDSTDEIPPSDDLTNVHVKSNNKAPLLPLPRVRPVITERTAPEIDDNELDAYLEKTSPWRRRSQQSSSNHHGQGNDVRGSNSASQIKDKTSSDSFENIEISQELRLDELKGIVARLRPPMALEPVWSSLGTASGSQVSVWQLDETKASSRTAVRLCVGHYCVNGVDDPLLSANTDEGQCSTSAPSNREATTNEHIILCLELCDTYTFRRNRTKLLLTAADRFCPPPIRFRQVWHLPQGDRSVYGWAPVPKSNAFVSLGHVCTRHPEPPDIRCVRTVPLAWCQKRDALNELGQAPAWTNSSLGGRKGSLWRQLSTSLLLVARGYTLPAESPLYTLSRQQLSLADFPELLTDRKMSAQPASTTVQKRTSITNALPKPPSPHPKAAGNSSLIQGKSYPSSDGTSINDTDLLSAAPAPQISLKSPKLNTSAVPLQMSTAQSTPFPSSFATSSTATDLLSIGRQTQKPLDPFAIQNIAFSNGTSDNSAADLLGLSTSQDKASKSIDDPFAILSAPSGIASQQRQFTAAAMSAPSLAAEPPAAAAAKANCIHQTTMAHLRKKDNDDDDDDDPFAGL